jgi:hypothetical protein
MSAISTKPYCVTCGKEIIVLKCESCCRTSCDTQLVVQCDATNKQSEAKVNQQIQQHALMQQVDDWECNAINRIRETAEEARRLILKHTTERISLITMKLTKLTEQLQQYQRANNFIAKTESQWQDELTQLSKQLVEPSSVTVRQLFTPLVTKIHVDIPGKDTTD